MQSGTGEMCSPRGLPHILSRHSHLLLFISASVLFSQGSAYPLSPHRTNDNSRPSYSQRYAKHQTFNVRVVAVTCSAVSMMGSFIAFYWFCRMEKRFRHRLIMLLVFGDALRASWLFVFAIVSLTRGTVRTQSSFCQASGFMVQYGSETSDYAVLVMAIHSAIQVFLPSTSTRNDGLYPYRAYVYAGAFALPAIMSSLAFINPHWGYMSQGAFCSLPLRPFWYRLALAWIPRYVIATVILGLAVAIYTHVGFEFHSFSQMEESAAGRPSVSTLTPILSTVDLVERSGDDVPEMQAFPARRRASSAAYGFTAEDFASSRRPSAGTSLMESGGRSQSLPATPNRSTVSFPRDRRCSEFQLSPNHTRRGSVVKSADQPEPQPNNEVYQNHSGNASPRTRSASAQHLSKMIQERARIHKQLRLIFIYPMAYIIMWLVPFVNHCMTYQDKYAAHPIYSLSLLGTLCVASLGAVDCLIFSLRERPWRHIPKSDGTFMGSFVVWRRQSESTQGGIPNPAGSAQPDITEMATAKTPVRENLSTMGKRHGSSSLKGSFSSLARARPGGGPSDQQRDAAEMARMRLEYEKEDRIKASGERARETRNSVLETIESPMEETEETGAEYMERSACDEEGAQRSTFGTNEGDMCDSGRLQV